MPRFCKDSSTVPDGMAVSRTSLSEVARFCILIMIVACPQANGADLFNDLLFRATFDDTTTAELHKGDGVAQVEGPLQFEAGQFGRAVVVGDQFARIRYTVGSHAHPQNLSCRAGSLSFRFMAAGYRPDHPHTAFSGRLVAGDFHGDPRRADRFRPDAPRHMELAQTFTLADSARIHRVELSMKDSSGAFAVRNSLRMAITTLTAEGLPGEKVMVANNEFASTWVDPRAWSYRHFELKRAKVLPAGRYALVLTKPPESGSEYFHAQFPTGDANSLSGEYVATRHPGAHNPEDTHWRADRSQVLCFGVYAIE